MIEPPCKQWLNSSPQLSWIKLHTALFGHGPCKGLRFAGVMPASGMHMSVGALTSLTHAYGSDVYSARYISCVGVMKCSMTMQVGERGMIHARPCARSFATSPVKTAPLPVSSRPNCSNCGA